MKFYAGIGSRETPALALEGMTLLAADLEQRGYVLRSGGADGADTAFEFGVVDKANKRIYLPWAGFNGCKDGIVCGHSPALRELAARYHPTYNLLNPGVKSLHARNVAQVLGYAPEQFRSEFVVCWTKDGLGKGGTGQAIRVAKAFGVPVFDLAIPGAVLQLQAHLEKEQE